MRAKHILNFLPLGSKVRIVYERCSLTPITAAFVIVALVHCLVQISLQAVAYSANTTAGHTVNRIIRDAQAMVIFTYVEDDTLRICDSPPNLNGENCRVIAGSGSESQVSSRRASEVSGLAISPRDVNASVLDDRCIEALNWPELILYDARREDVSFLVFQVWLLGISIAAILNESIPHLVAALVTHALSSIWSVFQVSRTRIYARLYTMLVVNDACGGVNVIKGFWAKRLSYFVPILALNVIAFVITLFFSYKLFKVYAHQTFKRVGSLPEMNGLYSIILTFSVALHLSAFFVICSSALWLDVLFKGPLEQFAMDKTVSRIIFIHICVWTLPWIFVGWNSFRRESRLWSILFFVVGTAMIAAWSSVFPSDVYKQKFRCFPFFAAVTVSSFVMLVITFLLAVVCRLNFGKGLPQYLKNQELIDESMFIPVFLTRKRQSTATTVVFPDKRTTMLRRNASTTVLDEGQDLAKYPRSEHQMHDLESSDLKLPARIFDPESSLGQNSSTQQHGRRSLLRFLARPKTDTSNPRATWISPPTSKAKLVVSPGEVRRSERAVSLPASSEKFEHASGFGQSSRAEKNALSSTWSEDSSPLSPSWRSRLNSPRLPWQASQQGSFSSVPPSPSHIRLDHLDSPPVYAPHDNMVRSHSLNIPASSHAPSSHRRLPGFAQRPMSRLMAQSEKVGLPTRPNCFKKGSSVTDADG